MTILDTDCLSLLERQTGKDYLTLQTKLDDFPSDAHHHHNYHF
ncbi:hypothetical protein BH20ACI4_BH20ACI4_20710 [soil metagenome]